MAAGMRHEFGTAEDGDDAWRQINWGELNSAKQAHAPKAALAEGVVPENTLAWAQAELAMLVDAHTKVSNIIKKELIPQLASYERQGVGVPSELLEIYSQRGEFRALFQWWSSLSAVKFVKLIKLLGPDEDDALLSRLALHTPYPCKQLTQQPLTHEVVTIAGRFSFDVDDLDIGEDWELDPPPSTVSVVRCFYQAIGRLLDWHFVPAQGMKLVSLSYTTAAHLMEADTAETEEDLMFTLGALMDCRESVFNTVFGNALVARAWRALKFDFFMMRARDALLLFCFMRISHAIRHQLHPGAPLRIITMCIVVSNLWGQLALVAMSMRMYGCRLGWFKQMSKSGLIILLTELYTSVTVCALCGFSFYDQQFGGPRAQKCTFHHFKDNMSCAIGNHPNFLWMAVAMKWLQFSIFLLCTPMLGESALPAFRAVTGSKSARFLAFLLMIFMGVYQTYYVFPILDNISDDFTSLRSLLKIFRLTFLGDFDMWELEGEDPVTNATLHRASHRISGQLSDPEGNSLYHNGVRSFFVVASSIFTIAYMNVYIGLLSEEYSVNSKTARTSTLKLRATFMFQLLQIRWACPEWLQAFGPQKMERLVDDASFDGGWIIWDPELVRAPVDADDELSSLRRKVEALREMTGQVARRLQM